MTEAQVRARQKERFAAAAGYIPPSACVWTQDRMGRVVCSVANRLAHAAAQAMDLRREHPESRAHVRLHRQAVAAMRAHVCEDVPGGEIAANQRAERAEARALEALQEGAQPGA